MTLGRRDLMVAGAATAMATFPRRSRAAERPLTVWLESEVVILDPHMTTAAITRTFGYHVWDVLFAMDTAGDYQPQMVGAYTVSDDKLHWHFTLRDGLKFHDGSPVTGADCVASLKRWAPIDSLGRMLLGAGATMAEDGTDAFTITLAKPFPLMLSVLGKPNAPGPFIMPARVIAAAGTGRIKEMIGSGPFKFVTDQYRPGDSMVLARFDGYVPRKEQADFMAGGKVVHVDQVVLRVMPDDSTGVAALVAGEIDYMQYLPFDWLDRLAKTPNIKLMSLKGLDMFLGNFRLNSATGPFADPAVRSVLWKLVDQKDMLAAAGIGPKYRVDDCPSFFMCDTPLSTNAGSGVAKFDLAAAKAELAKTSYAGEPVVMLEIFNSISTSAGNLLAQNMKQVGFTVDEQIMDWGTVLARRAKKDGWSLFPVYSNGIDMASPLTNFYVGNNCSDYPGWSCDATMTKLLADFAAAPDDTARKKIAADIQEVAYRTTPCVMWGQFSRPAGYRSRLMNLIESSFPIFWNVQLTARLMTQTLGLAGLTHPVEILRDEWGIPHIRARTEADAHFSLGVVHAQDRLFQMELNRRRALGRAAEWLGSEAAAGDLLCRRLGMEAACRRDHAALGGPAKAMLDSYCAGVNAFLAGDPALPPEYALLDAIPEAWEPWHCIAAMRRLGLLMGSIWFKLWRALALPIVGAENVVKLRYDGGAEELLCIPPGATAERWSADLAALRPAIEALLRAMGPDETGGGSNNWAIGPARSATGRPILAGDPHRVFEVPGMYAQHHLACDAWDAIGLTVPGVPAFPHYMHNGRVAYCVTHAFVDIHDLYLELFDADGRVRRGENWEPVSTRTETIQVRGEASRTIEVTDTSLGPVIAGDPASGAALVLRSVQFAETDLSFDCLPRMLRATTVPALFEATRGWGLIDHNLVAADTEGRIGHLVRAMVPARARANGWLPVPGWTGDGAWQGWIPFEQMPHVIDPPGGVIVTANNRVVADGDEYLCTDCHPPYRAQRIAALIAERPAFAVADAATLHADVLSPNATLFQARLATLPDPGGAAGEIRRSLLAWDGQMDAASVAANDYNALRRAATAILVERSGLGRAISHPFAAVPPGISPVGQLWWTLPALLRADDTALLKGWNWEDVMTAALTEIAAGPVARPWGETHQPRFQHPLSPSIPAAARFDPPSFPIGGDGDTVMAIGIVPASGPAGTYGALCRYVIDVGDWDNSRWAVFGGASGHPDSPHYADQTGPWSACEMVPMRYTWATIEAAATARLRLQPP